MSASLNILNIGLDRDLLVREGRNEAQSRQVFYVQMIPARITHLVKAPPSCKPTEFDVEPSQVKVVPCPVRHWAQFVPAAISRGGELLARERFDLIQVQEPFVSGIVGAYLAWRSGLPLVVGLFGDEIDNPVWLAERPFNRIANHIGKFVLRRAAAVRTDSQAVASRLEAYGYRNLAFVPFLITNADQLAAPQILSIELRARLLGGCDGPLLLAVLRLEAEKNVPLMLDAFSELLKINPQAVLTVIGDGSLRAHLVEEAARSAPDRVRWLGWVPNVQLGSYYQAADLLLLSSDRESAARVLTESLLAGTPVLTTDTAGAREIIDDGRSGRIVAIGDKAAFAAALTEMCSDSVRLRQMGSFGQARMRGEVSGDAVVRRLRAVYDSALEVKQ